MMLKLSSLPTVAALSCAITATSFAQIALESSDFATDTSGVAASHTINLASLDLTGGSKLVVTIGGEGGGNGTDDNSVTSLTYGGVPMSPAVSAYNGNRGSSIFYLDLAGQSFTGSDFVVNYATSQDGYGFGAYVLSGTANGVSAFADSTQSDGQSTVSLTTPTDGEFAIAGFARNNFDDTNASGTGVQSPLTELYYASLSGSSAASAYASLGAAGTYDLTIYDITNNAGRVVAASFEAVPEPSTFAFLSFGVAVFFFRRRR